jgi:drug/metabolite transporter (DMT)-like permease
VTVPEAALFGVRSRAGAYGALAALTLLWGSNWIVMKSALARADPVVFNLQRTWLAVAFLFVVMAWQRRLRWPQVWWPILVTGFFQTTVNFGSTTMALAEGGIGRTAVLVFTMPFWTLLIARLVLGERVRGVMWFAVAFAFVGLLLVVEPWRWEGQNLVPKLWAVLSGFGWAAGTVATKHFQRKHALDMLNYMAWQMLAGVLPLSLLPVFFDYPGTQWSYVFAGLLFWTAVMSTAVGFLLWVAILRHLRAGTASLNMFAVPVIALISSMLFTGERLTPSEWSGIASIGAGLVILTVASLRAARGGEGDARAAPTPLEGG